MKRNVRARGYNCDRNDEYPYSRNDCGHYRRRNHSYGPGNCFGRRWFVVGMTGIMMAIGLPLPSFGNTVQKQPSLQLRHGPYFPSLDVLAPPSPEALFPAIVQPMHLVIRLSDRRVYVYQGDEVYTSYPIAVGKDGWETPTGSYEVTDMQEDPAWKNPFTGAVIPAGRNNPLGDRWIGFWTDGNNVIGFHGTPNEGSVGRAASHGCIRMFNRDVRELYAIAEVGMPVTVEP